MIALRTSASRAGLALFAALTLASPVASARHHHGHGDGGREDDDDRDESAVDAGAAGATGKAGVSEDDEGEDDDAGAPLVVERTSAQTEHRDALVAKERAFVRSLVHRDGKRIPMRERQAIGLHWRHVMRLLRIRELAEQDHDAAVVTGADALIERADKKLAAKLDGLGGKDGGAR